MAKKLTAKQKKMVADNLNLVHAFVHKYYAKEPMAFKRELISKGYEVVTEKVLTCDLSKGKYSTHVYNVLKFPLWNHSIKMKHESFVYGWNIDLFQANEAREGDGGGVNSSPIKNMGVREDGKDDIYEQECDDFDIQGKLKKLPKMYRDIIICSYVLEMSNEEIVAKVKIPKGRRIQDVKREAMLQFRSLFKPADVAAYKAEHSDCRDYYAEGY